MNRLSGKLSQKSIFILGAFLLFGLVYILNVLYPLVGEDWTYSFFWGKNQEESAVRIKNIGDILLSQYNHYMSWGGRSVVHAIDQLLLLMGEKLHNIANSLIYLLFVYMIYKMSNYRNSLNGSFFLIIALLMWIFLPDFPTNVLWITYSAVYLWGTLIVILFMYPFYKYYRRQESESSTLKTVFMFVGGIIAGWSYESISVSLVCFLLFLYILLIKEKRKIPSWMIWGAVGALAGCLILIFAPGNFLRLGGSGEVFIPDMTARLIRIMTNFIKCMLLPTVIYALLLFYFNKNTQNTDKRNVITISLLFMICGYISFLVMLPSPKFPSRTLFGSVILLITGIGILLANIRFHKPLHKNIYYALLLVLLLGGIYDYVYKYNHTLYLKDIWHRREVFIQEQKRAGIEDIVFHERILHTRGFISYDLGELTTDWPNVDYAKYYGVRSVKME